MTARKLASFRINEVGLQAVQKAAERDGVTWSEWIRQALSHTLAAGSTFRAKPPKPKP